MRQALWISGRDGCWPRHSPALLPDRRALVSLGVMRDVEPAPFRDRLLDRNGRRLVAKLGLERVGHRVKCGFLRVSVRCRRFL